LPTQRPPAAHIEIYGDATARRQVRVVALGDSTLTGPGLSCPDDVWLPLALRDLGGELRFEYVSLAVGGSRAADVLTRVPDALRLDPDIVVVAVGANDALHAVPLRQTRERLDSTISRLLRSVDVVAVANVGDLGNVARVPSPLSSAIRLRGRRTTRMIERVVEGHDGAVLLDVTSANSAFRDRDVFTPDLFHPGIEGHRAWARAVTPGLRTALERLAGAPHRSSPPTVAARRVEAELPDAAVAGRFPGAVCVFAS
jgi:acyl-CoA thioesterase-1